MPPRRSSPALAPALPPTRPAVLYARVSSRDQEREGFSIPAQQKLLRSYADDHGLHVEQEFVDVETAKRAGRTNFVKMLAWLRKHASTCRVILVEKTDRLYRNLKDWVTLDELDLEIHLVKEGVVLSDDSRSSDKFMHGIKVLMAKNYIDNLSEEATKGMREKAEQGFWPSAAPIGYRNVARADGKKVIEPDPKDAPFVVRAFELAAAGDLSVVGITKILREAGLTSARSGNPLQKSAVHWLLRNPIYMGDFEWAGKVYQGSHTPLVTRALWERAQGAIDGRYRGTHETVRKDEFAYPGVLNCGHCGCAMSAQIKKERYIYYHCTGFKQKCPEPYVREEVLTEQFVRVLKTIALDDAMFDLVTEALRASHQDEQRFHDEAVARLEGECGKVQKRLDALYVDKLDGVVDLATYERHATSWREDLRKLRRDIASHEGANRSYLEEGIRLLQLGRVAWQTFPEQPADERRKLLRHVLSNCSWADKTLTVTYRQPFNFIAESLAAPEPEQPPEADPGGLSSKMVGDTGFEPVASTV